MDDLRARFSALDRVPVPELWGDIERRANARAVTGKLRRDAGRRSAGDATDGTGRPTLRRPLALLALLSLLLVALLVGGLIAGERPDNPTPPPATPRAVVPPTPVASPVSVASPLPPAHDPFGDRPGFAYWRLTSPDEMEVSLIHASRDGQVPDPIHQRLLFRVWPDPDPAAGEFTERHVLANPQGELVALAESSLGSYRVVLLEESRERAPYAQATLWGRGSGRAPDLAWSSDGAKLAIAYPDQRWVVLTRPADYGWLFAQYLEGANEAGLRLLGFSANGDRLLAWDARDGRAPWERPYSIDLIPGPTSFTQWIDLTSGSLVPLEQFPSGAEGLAVSNTTGQAWLVDPTSGRVLDDSSGGSWAVHPAPNSEQLGVSVSSAAAWTASGSIVTLIPDASSLSPAAPGQTPDPDTPAVGIISEVVPGAVPAFARSVRCNFLDTGRCSAVLLAVTGQTMIVGLVGERAPPRAGLGYDAINLINLIPGTDWQWLTSVDGEGSFDMHFAGLLRP